MFRKLYDWVFSLARSRHATPALAVVSFAESSFFPVPPDVMLAPMILARPEKAYFYAFVCTVASVLGGCLGYAIGHFLIETVGQAIIDFYGYASKWQAFEHAYAEYGVWIILIKGLTPIPYKLVTIASGAAHFDFTVFLIASIVTRGVRFLLIAGLLWRFGSPIRDFIERRLAIIGWIFLVGLVGGFIAVRYLF